MHVFVDRIRRDITFIVTNGGLWYVFIQFSAGSNTINCNKTMRYEHHKLGYNLQRKPSTTHEGTTVFRNAD